MRNKYQRDEQHIRLYYKMLESAAYKTLSCTACWLYAELKYEWRGKKKNEIKLTYSDIKERKKTHFRAISKAFLELEIFGFIDVIQRGGLFKGASIYALSDRWKEISDDPEKLKQANIILKNKLQRIKKKRRKEYVQ